MKKLLFIFMLSSAFSLAGCDDENLGIDDTNDNTQTQDPDNNNQDSDNDGNDVNSSDNEMFPDPIFRAYVMENFDIDGDGRISKEEAEEVTTIAVIKTYDTPDEEKIASLEGIQHFVNLTELFCDCNRLTTLDLSHNTALETLMC